MAFNRNRPFNNSRGGFSRDRGFSRPQMHQAVCDKCQKNCEVPFKPTSGKPVYCSDCFDRPTSNRSEGRNFDRPSNPAPKYDEQFALLNSKIDQILNILTPIAKEAEEETEPKPQKES